MNAAWTVVAAVGAATVALKATGPLLLGGRKLPAPLTGVVALLAPALLAALVVTQVVGGEGGRLVADARLLGLGAAVAALLLRTPVIVVVVAAAAATALARALA